MHSDKKDFKIPTRVTTTINEISHYPNVCPSWIVRPFFLAYRRFIKDKIYLCISISNSNCLLKKCSKIFTRQE